MKFEIVFYTDNGNPDEGNKYIAVCDPFGGVIFADNPAELLLKIRKYVMGEEGLNLGLYHSNDDIIIKLLRHHSDRKK